VLVLVLVLVLARELRLVEQRPQQEPLRGLSLA
jgi:hypothetical protein